MNSRVPTVSSAAPERCRALARAGAAFAGVLSISVLAAWPAASNPAVIKLLAATAYPSPQAAFGLLLCAMSLWLQARQPLSRGMWIAGLVCGAGALVLGGLAQCEWFFNRSLGLAGLLTTEAGRELLPDFTGQMSHGASALLVMLGVSVLLHRAPPGRWLWVTSVCTPLAMFLSLVALLGLAFSVPDKTAFWGAVGMAVQTAVAGLALAPSLILARPDRPLMAMIISPLTGGYLARRVLLAGAVLPLIVAGLQFAQVPASWLGAEAAAAVVVVASMAVLGLMVLVTCSTLNRIDERRRAAEASRALMLDELDHRVKNTLATVLAVCEHTLAGARDVEAFGVSFRGRIRAMAAAHEALAARRWDGVCLRHMVETEVAPFAGSVRIAGRDVLLSARAALPVAATLHELATNAAKYGALSRPVRGGVEVSWTIDDAGTLTLDWVEAASGSAGSAKPGANGGFGTSLIRGLIAHELKGSTDLSIGASGVRCRMVIPRAGRRMEDETRA